MWIGFLLMGFVFFIMTFNVMVGNYSDNEVWSYWTTLISTFVITFLVMAAAARFGKHSARANPKIVGFASALGASTAPVLTPFLLNWFDISRHTLLLYGGGWAAGLCAALAIAMPIIEKIELRKRAAVYWTPPADGL